MEHEDFLFFVSRLAVGLPAESGIRFPSARGYPVPAAQHRRGLLPTAWLGICKRSGSGGGSCCRGALLHDYFLYDWHDPDPSHRLHGFHHPARALATPFKISAWTRWAKHHPAPHVPLTPIPPKYREAILVCLVDKGCSLYEVFARRPYSNWRIQAAWALVLQGASISLSGPP